MGKPPRLLHGATVVKLRRLKTLGIRVTLDDFGTGYSTLNTSRTSRCPPRRDRSSVGGLGHDLEAATMVGAVVALAKSPDLSVTAGGTETAEQPPQLRYPGCDLSQGYCFAKSLAGDEIDAMLGAAKDGDMPRKDGVFVPVEPQNPPSLVS